MNFKSRPAWITAIVFTILSGLLMWYATGQVTDDVTRETNASYSEILLAQSILVGVVSLIIGTIVLLIGAAISKHHQNNKNQYK